MNGSPEPRQGGSPAAAWRHLPHEADIGIVGLGPTKAEAFRQAALGLTAVVTDPDGVRRHEEVPVTCRAADDEMLLVEWLDALIYEMAVRGLVFGDYAVQVADGELRATAYGEPVDVARHQPAVEIKGTTLTALQVRRLDGGWRVQCVVDV